jgi:hypothetical protein
VQTSLKTKSEHTPARDVVSLACYRSTRGAQIASRIDAAAGVEHARAQAVAIKLHECSNSSNVWHAEGVQNRAGARYSAAGTLDACNERLCPSCIAKRSSKSRMKAREAIQRAGRRKGEVSYMVTLTIPTMTAASCNLLKSLLILLRTWRLFTKKDFFTTPGRMRAGIKGVEFTLGDEKRLEREGREWLADVDGWHPHIHFVCLSSWIVANDLRADWTDCYISACREFDVTPNIRTKDGLLNCHLRVATQNAKSKTRNTIPLDSAIIEACKYITKFDSWLKIPEEQLLEIADIKRWPRMFELTGDCRKCTESTEPAPEAEPHDEEREAYFNLANLNAADVGRPPPEKGRSLLSKPLREIGREMIEQGRRAEFIKMLSERAAKVREYRREQLALMYPCAQFHSLDGLSWSAADETFTEAFLRCAGRELVEAANADRAEYSSILSDTADANLEAYNEHIRQQEERRWLDFVEYGRDVLLAGEKETVSKRLKIKRELRNAEFKKPIEQRAEEREDRAARIQQWSIYEATRA